MKLIHTSDLHLGKRLKEKSLADDQRYILDEMIAKAEEQKADALIIAGDVFDDGNTTTVESVRLLDYFLTELSKKGIKVFMISGNHDIMDRLEFGSSLFRKSNVFISSAFSGKMERYDLDDNVSIYMLPFVKPVHVRQAYPDEKIENYEDAVKVVMKNTPIDKGRKNILVTHQFIVNGSDAPKTCDSERSYVGGTESISSSLFKDFDYVALGHIHTPQNIGSDNIRYSGSPLKYSLSEKDTDKSLTVIDIDDKVSISFIPLVPKRDVRLIKGPLDQLIEEGKKDPSKEDFIYVKLDHAEDNAMAKLREVYPNVVSLEIIRNVHDEGFDYSDSEIERLDANEEFEKFYEKKTGEKMSDYQKKIIRELFENNGVIL